MGQELRKALIHHPPNRHLHGWYRPFPNWMLFILLLLIETLFHNANRGLIYPWASWAVSFLELLPPMIQPGFLKQFRGLGEATFIQDPRIPPEKPRSPAPRSRRSWPPCRKRPRSLPSETGCWGRIADPLGMTITELWKIAIYSGFFYWQWWLCVSLSDCRFFRFRVGYQRTSHWSSGWVRTFPLQILTLGEHQFVLIILHIALIQK